jgi:hypothetical protein
MKQVRHENISSGKAKVNKRGFRIALASAGISMSEFARQLDIKPQSIISLFAGHIKSKRISSAIETLISTELKKLRFKKAA